MHATGAVRPARERSTTSIRVASVPPVTSMSVT